MLGIREGLEVLPSALVEVDGPSGWFDLCLTMGVLEMATLSNMSSWGVVEVCGGLLEVVEKHQLLRACVIWAVRWWLMCTGSVYEIMGCTRPRFGGMGADYRRIGWTGQQEAEGRRVASMILISNGS
jgi:hypothetical protein